MKSIIDKLNKIDHIQQNKTTYLQHFKRSMLLSLKSGYACVVFCIHSIFPNIFEKRGSMIIFSLHKQLVSEN